MSTHTELFDVNISLLSKRNIVVAMPFSSVPSDWLHDRQQGVDYKNFHSKCKKQLHEC